MKDYYQILEVPESANIETIKSSYKRLALKYHPDKNNGSAFAEQKFKEVNAAYQTLSDPSKKSQYDLRFSYSDYTSQTTQNTYSTPRPKKKTNVYNRYGKYDWRKAPRYHKMPPYKIDENYFRVQLYTLAIFSGLALIILSAMWTYDYIEGLEEKRINEANNKLLDIADINFNEGKYDSTFIIVMQLINDFPLKISFDSVRNHYIQLLKLSVTNDLIQQHYSIALIKLDNITKYQKRQDLDVWRKKADIHLLQENYEKAVEVLDHIHLWDTDNLDLTMQLGDIYANKLQNNRKALGYYTIARNIFKKRLSSMYGDAFELVVNPEDIDPNYFNIFKKRANANFIEGNYEDAIRDCNWAIFLNKNAMEMYHLRGNCWYERNVNWRACDEWTIAAGLGYKESSEMINKYCR